MRLLKGELNLGEQEIIEDRQTLLSVLLELTVAASNLVDPDSSFSDFLERVAERLGCSVALCIEVIMGEQAEVKLVESIGLSHSSRELPLVGLADIHLPPYQELMDSDLKLWSFPIPVGGAPEAPEIIYYLQLYFDSHQQPKKQYYGMFNRLLQILKNALVHRKLYRSALEQKTLLEAQSECTMEGILIVSAEHKVRFLNQRFVDMWGFRPRINSVLDNNGIAHALNKVEAPGQVFAELESLEKNRDKRTQTELTLKDGQVFECLSVPIVNQNQVYYGRGWYFKDITENKKGQTERALLLKREIKARAEAEEERRKIEKALGTRDDFISIASHELRTPVTSLRLQLQLMQSTLKGIGPAELNSDHVRLKLIKILNMSEQQVERLTQLILGLLDVSRIQAGRLSLEPKQVNLSELLTEIVGRFNEQLSVAGHEVKLSIEPGVIGYWDPFRLEQVVNNLVVNAMKYATGKPIDIRLDKIKDTARLAIRDYGIGIRKDHQKQIFRKYERVSSTTNVTGLGLGLYIVRQIVKHHMGTIRVYSTPGRGSTFIVRLPLSAVRDARLSA